MPRKIIPVIAMSITLSCFAPVVANASDEPPVLSERLVITSDTGDVTLSGDTVESTVNGLTVRTVKKSSGDKTSIEGTTSEPRTDSSKVDTDSARVTLDATKILSSAAQKADKSVAEAHSVTDIRDGLRNKADAEKEKLVSGVASSIQKKSDAKIEAERLKKEEEHQKQLKLEKEREERELSAKNRLEALQKEAKLQEQRQSDAESSSEQRSRESTGTSTERSKSRTDIIAQGAEDTSSFNLQMGGTIPGKNTSRNGGASTIVDGEIEDSRGKRVANEAVKHIGKKYVWGGESPINGWDCSGFVQWLYAKEGVSIPRVAIDQAKFGVRVENPVPGDLVLQNNGSHIGIYLGDGKMISAWSPDRGTIIHSVDVLQYDFYAIVAE